MKIGSLLKSFFKVVWKGLGEKGKFATVVGLALAGPFNIKFMIEFFQGKAWGDTQLIMLAVANGIAMVWFILPSRISIKGGKGFEIVVED